jgi:general stress protein 26
VSDTGAEQAKHLLNSVRNAAMATVNDDGSPHNTPFHYIIDERRESIYWVSSPESQHSKNIVNRKQLFIVIYESNAPEGLYLEAVDAHELYEKTEIQTGLEVWNAQRTAEGKGSIDVTLVTGESPQRMYRTKLVRFWVNESQKDGKNHIIRDYRREIKKEELVNK